MGEAEVLIFIILISAAILGFFAVILALLFQYRKRKRIYENEKRAAAALHQAEMMHLKMEVQEELMQQIGREIHDSVSQKLTLASLHLQHTEYENKFSALNHVLSQSSSLINDSLDELRMLSRRLIRHTEPETDLVSILRTESEKVRQLKLCEVSFESDAHTAMMDTETAHGLLRISQEVLQNSLKHASCKTITMRLTHDQHSRTLLITDDGIGFDLNTTGETGVGLANIRKRASLLSIKLQQESMPGNGTTTELIIVTPQIPENTL